MKVKYLPQNKQKIEQWISYANLFASSLCPHQLAIQQFNKLSAKQRKEIKKKFSDCDKIMRIKIPTDESNQTWLTGVMVDANIIAYEYDIDPLTAVLCINPICKPNERIVVNF